jgi:hypothetical protein
MDALLAWEWLCCLAWEWLGNTLARLKDDYVAWLAMLVGTIAYK